MADGNPQPLNPYGFVCGVNGEFITQGVQFTAMRIPCPFAQLDVENLKLESGSGTIHTAEVGGQQITVTAGALDSGDNLFHGMSAVYNFDLMLLHVPGKRLSISHRAMILNTPNLEYPQQAFSGVTCPLYPSLGHSQTISWGEAFDEVWATSFYDFTPQSGMFYRKRIPFSLYATGFPSLDELGSFTSGDPRYFRVTSQVRFNIEDIPGEL